MVIDQLKPRRNNARGRFTTLALAIVFATMALYSNALAQIAGGTSLNTERRGHTATLLSNGNVLIVGGENQAGVVGQSEIVDPAAQTSAPAASVLTARTDHTATKLPDGRVLIAGGRGQSGQLTSTEFFDPASGAFSAGPSLIHARSGHTATLLADGRVLIAGGSGGASAELINAAMSSSSLATGSMNNARQLHSAIRLQSGKVLIVGGVDAQSNILNTAEIFDAASQSFSPSANPLQNPRGLSLLRLLPDGKVQVIGGDADFSMEIYDPADGLFMGLALLPPNAGLLGATLSTHSRAALMSTMIAQDALLSGVLTQQQLDLLDRADHSITELPAQNKALVAGGVNSAGQFLNSATLVQSSPATITTDKTDYAPGEIVTITGTNWMANEQVDMFFHEFPDDYPDLTFSAVADQQGRFVNNQFAPQVIDIGRNFTVTAIGQISGFTAQTVFKDNKNLTITFAGTGGGTISFSNLTPAGPFASCTGSPNPCVRAVDNNQQGTLTVTPNVGSVFTGWSGSFVGTGTTTCTGTTSPCTFFMGTGGGSAQSLTATFSAPVATNLTVSAASGTYGGSTGAITATLTRSSGGAAVSGKLITFTLNGGTVGTATTNASGVATLSSASLTSPSKINAGTYLTGVGASFAGDASFTSSSGTNSLTVNKRAITVTAVADTQAYDGTTSSIGVPTITSGGPLVSGDTASFTQSFDNKNVGTNKTLTPAGSVNDGNSGNNYTVTFASVNTGTINAIAASVTPNAASKNYGAADPAFTGTLNGFLAADNVTATYSRTAGETVAGSPYTISAVLSPAGVLGNYNITYNTADFTINAKAASVTALNNSKVYGSSDPALGTSNSGFVAGDLASITFSASRAPGENVGPYAITPSASGAVLSNYTVTYNNGTFTISKKDASVTPDAASKIFGALDPAFTGTLSGFLAADNVTATYSRTLGETVAGSPYTISATLSPAAVLGNYNITYNTANFTIAAWYLTGFYQPVSMSNSPIVWNTIKGGSTVPLKFNVYEMMNGTERKNVADIYGFSVNQVQCASGIEDPVDVAFTTTGGTSLRYDTTDGQFIQNWKTPNGGGKCYKVTMTTVDMSKLEAYFKTK